jgi:iron complex outermembrane receptor protein
MTFNSKLSCAIAAILGGTSAASVQAATGSDTDTNSDTIQEITVTAQRRVENMQDVPITIQALTAETLTQLNVQTFDDFIRYLPNVTSASTGPGEGSIYMRGLSTTLPGVQGSGGIGSFPNVAVYLDDQSGALPGRNLDIYAADLERIEVLEGPQGTLFGSGAESGVLRYITNKPKIDVTEGNVSAAYEYTAHGDPSSNVQAVLNLPLISDTLAVRGVIYSDSRGGYINNVQGTFVRQSTDTGIHYAGYVNNVPGPATPQNSASNTNLVQDAFNPVTYKGIRVSALWKINEDWNALLTQSYQDMNSQGVFYETPESSGTPGIPLPDLSVQNYTPTYDKDRFTNTALTINGRIGDLKLVYTGGYLVRNIEQQGDYTNYARGVYADYYQCISPYESGKPKGQCYSPVSYWRDRERNTHDSQEFRLSTPDDWRVRGLLGVFWEEYEINENIDWFYRNDPACSSTVTTDCFVDVGPPNSASNPVNPSQPLTYPNVQVNNPSIRPDNESYFDDIIRGFRQQALFGSMDYEIIPKVLTATFGTRYYRLNTSEVGFSAGSFGCFMYGSFGQTAYAPPCVGNQPPNSPRYDYSNNETSDNLNQTYSGFRSRANLSWKITPDILLYYTWSQGYRPGGFNRGALERTPPDGADYVFKEPQSFQPDTLTNNEVGWKTQWLDHRVEFNGAVYQEDWKNVQEELFESCCFGNLSFVINGPNYRVRGLETQLVARPLHGVTVTAAAAWNSSDLVSEPPILDASGHPITDPRIGEPFGAIGSPLAQSPPFQGTLRVRYDFQILEYNAFWQIGGQHQAHSISATSRTDVPNQPGYAYDEPGFSTYDANAGLAKGAWLVMFYGENLTNTQADLYENPNQFVDAKTVNRPRTAGMRFTYKF